MAFLRGRDKLSSLRGKYLLGWFDLFFKNLIVLRTRRKVQFSGRLDLLSGAIASVGPRAAESSVKPAHFKHILVSLPLFIFLYIFKNSDSTKFCFRAFPVTLH